MSTLVIFETFGGTLKQELDIDRLERIMSEMSGVAATVQTSHLSSSYLIDTVEKLRYEMSLPIESVVAVTGTRTRVEEPLKKGMMALGLDPNRLVVVNVREQCAWVHDDGASANTKAERLIKAGIEKVRMLTPLKRQVIKRFTDVLVVGGGIAGIQASIDLSAQGIKVHLVERSPSIGGVMALLVKTFPTDDCAICICGPKMADIANDPNINLMTYCEVEEAKRVPEGYHVKILKKPRYIDFKKCVGCGQCAEKCPTRVPDEWSGYIGERRSAYMPFSQSIPRKYVIDPEHCLYLNKGICRVCEKVCPSQAIDFNQKPEIIELDVGAIIVAVGFENFDPSPYKKFGSQYEDVITQFQMARLLDGEGPTAGKLKRPSDGKRPSRIVMVQCVGSRDPEINPYCSRYCCMAAIKHAELTKIEQGEDIDITILYKDIRAGGKGFEEYYNSTREKFGVKFVHGNFQQVVKLDDGTFLVLYTNDRGERETLTADLVILSVGMVPSKGSKELAAKLGIDVDKHGFLSEVDPKVASVITKAPGIYICGACGAPKDIPESVAQASAAAGMATIHVKSHIGEVGKPLLMPVVDEEACGRCGICVSICPYSAITLPLKGAVEINNELCQSCGLCISTCPTRALENSNYGFDLLDAQLAAILKDRKESEMIIVGLAC
ncbi:CoB--CoM heterodisulfide reductase iron-sulfur subunit A family protein, partial [Candidatus Bathyarchaeota archaeon]|nr:CoB--CoM heterodisulfide reductase iron-sulfur subunit A family protein [Candidatus Bathyarchaeota archaeon]